MVAVTLREERATSEFATPSASVEDAAPRVLQPFHVAVVPVRSGSSSRCANSANLTWGSRRTSIFRENHDCIMLLFVVVVLFVSAIILDQTCKAFALLI